MRCLPALPKEKEKGTRRRRLLRLAMETRDFKLVNLAGVVDRLPEEIEGDQVFGISLVAPIMQ